MKEAEIGSSPRTWVLIQPNSFLSVAGAPAVLFAHSGFLPDITKGCPLWQEGYILGVAPNSPQHRGCGFQRGRYHALEFWHQGQTHLHQRGEQFPMPGRAKEVFVGWVQWFAPVTPALWEAKVGGSPEVWSLRPAWPTWWNPVSTKNTKISWVWWQAPITPAIQEAEAGEVLEPRRRRLQWAEIVPWHSSLGDKSESPSQKKKKKEM